MKADYLRYIYECLSGDNGLLSGETEKIDFSKQIEEREKKEINKEEMSKEKNKLKRASGNVKTLLEFMENEVFYQYELAKLEICQSEDNQYARVQSEG